MQFNQKLKEARIHAGKTQTEIALLLQTSRQQYSRWESGEWQMPIEHYKTLAEHYGVTIDYLAGRGDTSPKPVSK